MAHPFPGPSLTSLWHAIMETARTMRTAMRSLHGRMFGNSAVSYEEIETRIRNSPFQKGAARRMRGMIFVLSAQEIILMILLALLTLARLVLVFPVQMFDFAFAYFVWNLLGALFGLLVRAYGNARTPYVVLLLVRLFILALNATSFAFSLIQLVQCIQYGGCGVNIIYYVSYLVFAGITIWMFSLPILSTVISTLRLFENARRKT